MARSIRIPKGAVRSDIWDHPDGRSIELYRGYASGRNALWVLWTCTDGTASSKRFTGRNLAQFDAEQYPVLLHDCPQHGFQKIA